MKKIITFTLGIITGIFLHWLFVKPIVIEEPTIYSVNSLPDGYLIEILYEDRLEFWKTYRGELKKYTIPLGD